MKNFAVNFKSTCTCRISIIKFSGGIYFSKNHHTILLKLLYTFKTQKNVRNKTVWSHYIEIQKRKSLQNRDGFLAKFCKIQA